jgi:hypothetical protein
MQYFIFDSRKMKAASTKAEVLRYRSLIPRQSFYVFSNNFGISSPVIISATHLTNLFSPGNNVKDRISRHLNAFSVWSLVEAPVMILG